MRAMSDKAFREHLKTLWVRPGVHFTSEEIERKVQRRKMRKSKTASHPSLDISKASHDKSTAVPS
jgi:hypothetical protein